MRTRYCGPFLLVSALCASAQQAKPWLLPNFSDRIEFTVSNSSGTARSGLVTLSVSEIRKLAPGFPGTLALCMDEQGNGSFLPVQVDDLNRDHDPDEVAIEVGLSAHTSKLLAVYYSGTLRDEVPYTSRVSASHGYGYNRATAALESELIGYRTYGGFLFDVQAHRAGKRGLFNALLGYSKTAAPPTEGRDIVHYGQTLGLGGLFLQSGTKTFQPSFNTPDYTHKPAKPNEPVYRVLASGPLRAIVEASAAHWDVEGDQVAIRATYEMRSGEEAIRAHVQVLPLKLSHEYVVGAGVLDLAGNKVQTRGVLAVQGTQDPAIGALALGIGFENEQAKPAGAGLRTSGGNNLAAQFPQKLDAVHEVEADYRMTAAWSGSGYPNPLQHVQAVLADSFLSFTVSKITHDSTPHPEALQGEPN